MFFLLADDHLLFCEGMAYILQTHFPNAKITLVSSWFDTHTAIAKQSFDLAFINLTMPRQTTWEAELQQVLATAPSLRVCVISTSSADIERRSAYRLGAAGFFHKHMSSLEIRQYIIQLLAGERVFPTVRAVKKLSPSPLTVRQRDIMQLLAEGYCNKEIARRLNLSEGTVKRHFSSIFNVLGAKNRVEALRIMQQHNW